MYLNLNLPTSLGYIQKIRLVSKNICRTYSPQEREDVEQHLVLYRNGRVFFSAYQLVNDSQAYIIGKSVLGVIRSFYIASKI